MYIFENYIHIYYIVVNNITKNVPSPPNKTKDRNIKQKKRDIPISSMSL